MRLATLADLPAIGKGLAKLQTVADNYGFVNSTNLTKATLALINEIRLGNGYIVGDYLVMVAEVTPWYSDDKVLQEWFTMKLKFKAEGRNLLAGALILIALKRSCTHIMTADSSGGPMAKQWANSGFTPLTQSFYQRVSHGIH